MRTYPDALRFSVSAAASVLRGERFLSCLWELTYRCNARCAICSYWKTPSKPADELTREQIAEGLGRAFEYGTRFVNFTGGEPTLRTDLEDIVAAASHRGMWTSMVTNGSRLTPARIRALKDAGLDNLLVSLDSPVPGVHDKHRGIPGLFAQVVRVLEWLHDDFLTGHRSGGLMCVIARHNLDAIDDIARLADSLGVYVVLQPYHRNKTGDSGPAAALDRDAVRRILALKDRTEFPQLSFGAEPVLRRRHAPLSRRAEVLQRGSLRLHSPVRRPRCRRAYPARRHLRGAFGWRSPFGRGV